MYDEREEIWRMHRAQQAGNPSRARRHNEENGITGGGEDDNERVVAALADAYGDAHSAAVFAAASDSEKLKNVYFTYKETVEGGEGGGGGGGGDRGGGGRGSRPSRHRTKTVTV